LFWALKKDSTTCWVFFCFYVFLFTLPSQKILNIQKSNVSPALAQVFCRTQFTCDK